MPMNPFRSEPGVSFLRTLDEKSDPSHAAVIVVDMQKEFCESSELAARLAVRSEVVSSAVIRLKSLLDEARRNGVLIVYTQEIDDPKFMSGPMWERLYRKNMRPYCLSGTRGIEIIDELPPQPGDEIVVKHRFSGFFETDLDMLLRARGIETLIVTGTQTNVCVDSTARDAYFRGYYVVVLDDCTFTYDPGVHQMALQTIEEAFGVVARSDQVIASWRAAS